MSRFAPGGDHGEKKQRVLDKLAAFFERYFGLGGSASGGDYVTDEGAGGLPPATLP